MHLREHELKFYVLGCMSSGQASVISSHLAQCDSCTEKLSQTTEYITSFAEPRRLPMGDNEKRHEPRIPAAEPASMRMIYPSQVDRIAIKVVNVSRRGLRLCVPEFAAPGVVCQILLKGIVMTAEVRYCLPVGKEFHIGIEIQEMVSNGMH